MAKQKTIEETTLGGLIKLARNRRAMSQSEASRRVGLKKPSHWCEIESGLRLPSLALLSRMAEVLGVKLSRLMPDKIEPITRERPKKPTTQDEPPK